jgi:hypothetical protein
MSFPAWETIVVESSLAERRGDGRWEARGSAAADVAVVGVAGWRPPFLFSSLARGHALLQSGRRDPPSLPPDHTALLSSCPVILHLVPSRPAYTHTQVRLLAPSPALEER